MELCLIGNDFRYEFEKLVRIFLPFEKIVFSDHVTEPSRCAVAERCVHSGTAELKASLSMDGKNAFHSTCVSIGESDDEKTCERLLAVQLYECFVDLTGYVPQWGILTGVRPAKLFSRLCDQIGLEETKKYFSEELKVSSDKITLCGEAVAGEKKITALSRPESFSLYLSVPFCPTRCSYCSFVSHSVEHAKKLIPQYVELLCRELQYTGEIARDLGLHPETVYIGGGTPTTLSAEQLTRVMNTVRDSFDLSCLREYTVEAGRPDTITSEKLDAIRSGGATRISINPQTMQDDILETIGRRHTVAQTVDAFHLARENGFDSINMDLIAGLPGDTPARFKDTLFKVLALQPESVTVHSLSMKRASGMTAHGEHPEIDAGISASEMVGCAHRILKENGVFPYYMYRQSKTVGNLENVGYAKPGHEGLYNVYIMDETHTVLACGASAVTKLRQPDGPWIERIFNFKYPYEYISRFEEMMERKDKIREFYQKYPWGNSKKESYCNVSNDVI